MSKLDDNGMVQTENDLKPESLGQVDDVDALKYTDDQTAQNKKTFDKKITSKKQVTPAAPS